MTIDNVRPPIAIAHVRLADLSNAPFQSRKLMTYDRHTHESVPNGIFGNKLSQILGLPPTSSEEQCRADA